MNSLMLVDGFTNLYLSITAGPRIMLSTMREQNMDIAISAMSAIIPKMDDMNSNFLHPFALLINCLNLLCAFQY